jgi:4-hydroxy-2-oxoheptanedioate aldolase
MSSTLRKERSVNKVRELWSRGEAALGTFLVIPSIRSAEVIGRAGYDWVVIEQQHGAVAQEELLPILHALELGGATALVRVGENDLIGIARALDLGARGVIVPMVSTPEQARTVGQATRFPPQGTRSYGGLRHHASPADANEDVICVVMIETPEAVANADAIAATPGVDGLLLGPADLAVNMGLTPDLRGAHSVVFDAFVQVEAACRRHGRQAGLVAFNPGDAKSVVERGATFVPLRSDLGHVVAGSAEDVRIIREIHGSPVAVPST